MKPTVLILPAAIRSHVLPSLYLADALSDDYEVVYAVHNDILADIVTTNGYRTVKQSGHLVGYGMEAHYIVSLKQKPTYGRVLKAYYTQEMYKARQRELYTLIDDLRPSAIFIDLFACTDYWALHPRRAEFKLLFFNPMPSTYRVQGYPIVSEGFWNKSNTEISPSKPPKIRLSDWFSRPKIALMSWVIAEQRKKLQQIAPLSEDATVTQVIANVPELILAPLAFEFAPEVRQPNQHYLGLCMRPHRQDTELDPAFEEAWGDAGSRFKREPAVNLLQLRHISRGGRCDIATLYYQPIGGNCPTTQRTIDMRHQPLPNRNPPPPPPIDSQYALFYARTAATRFGRGRCVYYARGFWVYQRGHLLRCTHVGLPSRPQIRPKRQRSQTRTPWLGPSRQLCTRAA